MNKNFLLAGSAAFALISFAAPVHAQDEEDDRVTLDTITVTSTKRETTLQDTPVTVSVIGGEEIANSGATEVTEVFAGVPGLALLESPGDIPTPTIRGIGSSSANQTFEQSVGLFLDGIYKPRGAQYRDAMFDVERIEVIRGAQGVVFGKNTSVGAISVTSKKPGDEFGGEVWARYETEFESHVLGGAVDLPASDILKFRIGAQISETGGYVDNIATGTTDGDDERTIVRGTAVLDPGTNWDATLMVQHSDVETTGNLFQFVELFDASPFAPLLTDEPFVKEVDGDRTVAGFTFPADRSTIESTDAAFTLNYNVNDNLTLTSLTAYSEFDYNNIFDIFQNTPESLQPITFLPVSGFQNFTEEFQQFTQEFRFDYQKEGFDALGGVFFQDQELSFTNQTGIENFILPAAPVPPGVPDFAGFNLQGVTEGTLDQDVSAWSVFAQLGFELSPRFRLDVGARYSDEKKEGLFTKETVSFLGLTPLTTEFIPAFPDGAGGFIPNPAFIPVGDPRRLGVSFAPINSPSGTASVTVDDTALDGAITLSYDLTDNWLFTLSAAQGTKSAGLNNSSATGQVEPNPFVVEPETAQTIEAGLKGSFADGRGYLAAALFYSEIEDYQVSVFDPNTGAAGGFVTRNIDATSQGLEVEGLFAATENLTLNGNFALLNAENDETGGRLNGAPEFAAAFGGDYEDEISETLSLLLGGSVIHSDGYLHRQTPIGAPPLPQNGENGTGAYTLANAYAGLKLNGSGAQLRFDVRNLTDETYSTFTYPHPIFGAGFAGTLNRPRTYEVSLRVPF